MALHNLHPPLTGAVRGVMPGHDYLKQPPGTMRNIKTHSSWLTRKEFSRLPQELHAAGPIG